MKRYFGTDGVRGTVNQEPMTAEFALKLGRAAGFVLTQHLKHKPSILIGKDTRLSGYMLESALCAGLTAQGMSVLLVGPVPTPAVAYLTRSLRADAGVVLSASHNPAGDNGIKFFGSDGFKLPDEVEHKIESVLTDLPPLPQAFDVGKAARVKDARGRYIEFCKSSLPKGFRLDGLKVVVDCANGAAYDVAPRLFDELGCHVMPMHCYPDGCNINLACGSTHPESMCQHVIESNADVGFAFDGDADRLIACDANGQLVDGDRVIAILAQHQQGMRRLTGGGVVTTIMSNMGLGKYLNKMGLEMHRAAVGDRYVLEMMRERGCNLGGEQSGHIIQLNYNTTGDGMITALQVLCAMRNQDKALDALADDMPLYPQKIWNIVLQERINIDTNPDIQAALSHAEASIGEKGRINVRMSGTESKLRIMVEAEDEGTMLEVGQSLVEAIQSSL